MSVYEIRHEYETPVLWTWANIIITHGSQDKLESFTKVKHTSAIAELCVEPIFYFLEKFYDLAKFSYFHYRHYPVTDAKLADCSC